MIAHGTGFVKGSSARRSIQLGAHLRYLEHRKGDDDREIFGKESDAVSRAEAMIDLEAHNEYVAYHKIVLSPSAEERVGITDWREWTRDVMQDLGERKGMDLTWYAVQHDNTDDPHVHIILAGGGTRDTDGATATVKMFPRDFRALEDSGLERSQVDHLRLARAEIGAQDRLEARELGIALPTQAAPEHSTHPDPALPSSAASPAASAPPTTAKADAHDADKATAPDTPSATPEMPSLLPLARVVTKPIIDIDR